MASPVVINKAQYLVVGVIKDRLPRARLSGKPAEQDGNMDVYLPIRTCRVRFGERVMFRQGSSIIAEQVELHQINLSICDIDHVRSAGAAVGEMLKRNHARKDWEVAVPLDRLQQAEDAARSLQHAASADRLHFAVGRWDRHHEYHARHRHGTDSRNRNPSLLQRNGGISPCSSSWKPSFKPRSAAWLAR